MIEIKNASTNKFENIYKVQKLIILYIKNNVIVQYIIYEYYNFLLNHSSKAEVKGTPSQAMHYLVYKGL